MVLFLLQHCDTLFYNLRIFRRKQDPKYTQIEIRNSSLEKEKDQLYSQVIDLRKEVEQVESVRSCIEKLQQENRELI
ncbi:hypothetical protein FUSO4_05420 [Fusobacterium necrophorum DJ-1]|uniref:Uncharacterized protein n=1 Tax=Fusobacterium necrophorum DJ-2 TaxID=1441737 RepID=A0AB73C2L9_9FUSO|nr:hypothetical protein FUSO4_05420 [Fusobacterium necrophorum DJ-1]KDE71877.1 hypothetical protein FUSO8_07040 [Fusobacterium necrophorum DJ-2]